MIPLSIGQIAQITGASLDNVPDPLAVVTGPVVIDSARSSPARCSRRCPASGPTGTSSRGRQRAPAQP